MNKKGFTLTELLVVVGIIAVLAVIIVPSIIAINKGINERLFEQRKELAVSAAELYAGDNPDIFNGADTASVSIWRLLSENYLEANANDDQCDVFWNETSGKEEPMPDAYKSSSGCVTDPVHSTSINNVLIKLSRKTVGVVGEYPDGNDDNEPDGTPSTLVEKVCEGFEIGSFKGKYSTDENAYCACNKKADGTYELVKATVTGSKNTGQKVDACIIVSNDENGNVNNWLKYGASNANWRVLGLYMVEGKATPKMITASVID